MSKKNFTTGVDALLSPTTIQVSSDASNSSASSRSVPRMRSKVLILLTDDIKYKLYPYCLQNRINKQDFISNLIIQYIENLKYTNILLCLVMLIIYK